MTDRPAKLSEGEFEAIQAALTTTLRGRRFLDEYVKRQRDEEMTRLVAAAHRIEAQVCCGEQERDRRREDSARAAEIVRRLGRVLDDLQPLADAKLRARTLELREGQASSTPASAASATGLERRFAALVRLEDGDELDLKLFG